MLKKKNTRNKKQENKKVSSSRKKLFCCNTAQWNMTFDAVKDMEMLIDKDFRIVKANKSMLDFLKLPMREIYAKPCYQKVHKTADPPDTCPNLRLIASNKHEESEFFFPDKGMWALISVDPVFDKNGKFLYVSHVIRDITGQKRKEENLKEINRLSTEFVSMASHQLRTPLTAIQWVVERLNKTDSLSDKGREYINDIYLSARRLSELVSLLLNVSRIESGKMSLSPVSLDVVNFIENYLKECAPLVEQKKLVLIFEKHPPSLRVVSDQGALRNIIQSIVTNAIEYTPEGGSVEVSLKFSDGYFYLNVSDTGVGIPKEEQEKIFKKFMRGSNAKLVKADGTGLGLYLAKQAVDLLGGDIRFRSPGDGVSGWERGIGTTFYVKLPVICKKKKHLPESAGPPKYAKGL